MQKVLQIFNLDSCSSTKPWLSYTQTWLVLIRLGHVLLGQNIANVSSFSVDDAKYLYHDGTAWKFGNVSMLKPEKFENLLFCTTCGQHYYYTGAHVRITPVIRGGWQCQKCKWCQNCRQANQDDRYLLCDVCDGAFHAHCLRPQMASVPKNGWKCKVRLDKHAIGTFPWRITIPLEQSFSVCSKKLQLHILMHKRT